MSDKRITFLVEEEVYSQMKFIPQGSQSEVLRQLCRLIIRTQRSNLNRYVAEDILKERLMLIDKDQVKEEFVEMFND
jgi:hypothetical protein